MKAKPGLLGATDDEDENTLEDAESRCHMRRKTCHIMHYSKLGHTARYHIGCVELNQKRQQCRRIAAKHARTDYYHRDFTATRHAILLALFITNTSELPTSPFHFSSVQYQHGCAQRVPDSRTQLLVVFALATEAKQLSRPCWVLLRHNSSAPLKLTQVLLGPATRVNACNVVDWKVN